MIVENRIEVYLKTEAEVGAEVEAKAGTEAKAEAGVKAKVLAGRRHMEDRPESGHAGVVARIPGRRKENTENEDRYRGSQSGSIVSQFLNIMMIPNVHPGEYHLVGILRGDIERIRNTEKMKIIREGETEIPQIMDTINGMTYLTVLITAKLMK